MLTQQQQAFLNKVLAESRQTQRDLQRVSGELAVFRKACENQPQSVTKEIDSIPGRRVFYNLGGQQTFDSTLDGLRGQPINMLVSQDGAFVMTHYPVVGWYPSAPSTASLGGQWQPIYTFPLPAQEITGDRIDLSWEMIDGGSQRNLQNQAIPPMFSSDGLMPLPVPTLFTPNTVIQFVPTFNNISFDANQDVPTTEGTLVVALPGYRPVNV